MSPSFSPEFRRLIARELAALGLKLKKWHGSGLDAENADGKTTTLGLANLYRLVQGHSSRESAEIVRDFLRRILGVASEPPQMPDTMEEAAPQLLVRIGKPFALGGHGPWSEPLPGASELVVSLVIDFPSTMAFVPEKMMTKSAAPPQEWVRVAMGNLHARTPKEWLRILRADKGIYCCHTNDSYDASRALILCEHAATPRHGWLVAVPSRDWLFAIKAELSQMQDFHTMKLLAEKNHAKEPYPISDKVYWVRPGKPWLEFPIEIGAKDIRLIPPPEFVEALELVEKHTNGRSQAHEP